MADVERERGLRITDYDDARKHREPTSRKRDYNHPCDKRRSSAVGMNAAGWELHNAYEYIAYRADSRGSPAQ